MTDAEIAAWLALARKAQIHLPAEHDQPTRATRDFYAAARDALPRLCRALRECRVQLALQQRMSLVQCEERDALREELREAREAQGASPRTFDSRPHQACDGGRACVIGVTHEPHCDVCDVAWPCEASQRA